MIRRIKPPSLFQKVNRLNKTDSGNILKTRCGVRKVFFGLCFTSLDTRKKEGVMMIGYKYLIGEAWGLAADF